MMHAVIIEFVERMAWYRPGYVSILILNLSLWHIVCQLQSDLTSL